jgi:hypothetical protein
MRKKYGVRNTTDSVGEHNDYRISNKNIDFVVFAIGTKGCGSEPAQGHGFLRAIKPAAHLHSDEK